MAMNYRWPTHASLGQALDQQSSASLVGDSEVSWVRHSGSGGEKSPCATARGGYDARSAISTARSSRDANNDWRSRSSSGCTEAESSSARPFHIFRGRKTHQIAPVRDCFVPLRHLSEPTMKDGLVPVHAMATPAYPAGEQTIAGPESMDPAAASAPSGLSKAVHLPPMAETPREPWSAAGLAGPRVARGGIGKTPPFNRRPLARQQPPAVSSFERKLVARRQQWSREEEAEAEDRAFREQRRAQEALRGLRGLDGGGEGHGGGTGYCYRVGATTVPSPSTPTGGVSGRNGDASCPWQRRARSHGWRYRDSCHQGDGKATELIPEREEQLLTQMFGMLDARNRGEVRLDEVLFYMTENAQVKTAMKQVTLWMLTKTRRWAWVEELLVAQPGRTLTLPALLAFSRSLHEESRVPRKHLRLARGLREVGVERRDARSKRLLPADLVEETEVEALFRKGFEWYRAWIVRCHADDTFDVRFTRPPSLSSAGSSPRGGGEEGRGQRPEVETSPRLSGSEEGWNSDEENSTMEAEEEWKATCDSVARFIGIPPDLGETETEILGQAFDAIASLVSPTQATHTPRAPESCQTHAVGEISSNSTAATAANQQTTPNHKAAMHQDFARRQQHEEEEHPERSNAYRDFEETPSSRTAVVPRIPAGEIIRILRGGAVDSYRRASPALSAACIYGDFAEGLEGAAARKEQGSAAHNGSGMDKHPAGERDPNEGHDHRRRRNGTNCGEDDIGGDEWGSGVSKAEFCDYFEAVTDVVDLNGLSLVPQVQQGLTRPPPVGA